MTDIVHAPIHETLALLHSGALSARELTELHLARIGEHNGALGAVTDLLADSALASAGRIDAARARRETLAPLAGLPVLVKDIIDTVPARCSAGMPLLADRRPMRDAAIVDRLRAAGCVILGVTATDPGAFGVRTQATRHPIWPDLTVGGSSGGSAAALVAGFGYAALGTDTGGSIRIPAAACEIAGIKPTHGRWPLDGIRALTHTLDHVGPMTRSVADLSAIWGALDAGPGVALPQTPRIGVDFSYFAEADASVHAGVEAGLAAARSLGWPVVEVRLPAPSDVVKVHGAILLSEAAALYEAEGLADHPDLPDLPRANITAGRAIPATRYVAAMQARKALQAKVEAALSEADILLLPTLAVTPPQRLAPEVMIAGAAHDFVLALVRYTCLFDHTGHPALAMPATAGSDAPGAGIQLIARHGADAALIAVATQLEARLGLAFDRTIR